MDAEVLRPPVRAEVMTQLSLVADEDHFMPGELARVEECALDHVGRSVIPAHRVESELHRVTYSTATTSRPL